MTFFEGAMTVCFALMAVIAYWLAFRGGRR